MYKMLKGDRTELNSMIDSSWSEARMNPICYDNT